MFLAWKAEYGCRKPRTRRGVKGLRLDRPIAFEEATPYECADPASHVTDYASLCLHLAQTEYPPMLALLDSVPIHDAVALAALIEPERVELDSLLWALRISIMALMRHKREASNFRQLLIDSAPLRRFGVSATKNLAAGRKIGAQAKRNQANVLHEAWQRAAVEYLVKVPSKSLDDAARHIFITPSVNPGENALRTIRDAISGCDKLAREQLSKTRS